MRRILQFMMGAAVIGMLVIPATPVFAASNSVQGAVLDVGATDPFGGVCVRSTTWSGLDANNIDTVICPTTGVFSCASGGVPGQYCDRKFVASLLGSGRSGYSSVTEDIQNYAAAADNQPMFLLMTAVAGTGTQNAIGYYSIQSQIAAQGETGKITDENCVGATAVSCFSPGTTVRRSPSQVNTVQSPDLGPIGGFNPVPEPRPTGPPSAGIQNLNWDPFFANSKDSVPIPFKHYKVYRFADNNGNNVCDRPSDTSPWVLVGTTPGTTFPAPILSGAGIDCNFFALRLAFNGPANATVGPDATLGELSVFSIGTASEGVGVSPLSAQVINLNASYIGKSQAQVTWTGAVETGITGYIVSRSNSLTGPFKPVSELIVAKGDGSNYSFNNKVTRKESPRTIYYQLELHLSNGTSTLGPISVTLPAAKKN